MTLIKGHNSVENEQKIKWNCPNLDLIYQSIRIYSEDIGEKHFLHKSRAITLLKIN